MQTVCCAENVEKKMNEISILRRENQDIVKKMPIHEE